MYYNNDYINTLSDDEICGLIAHEVAHVAFGDLWRRENRNVELWNIATDIIRNTILSNDGFRLPEGGIATNIPNHIRNKIMSMSVEDIYELISKPDDEICNIVKSGKLSDDHSMWGKAEIEPGLKEEWRENVSRTRQLIKTQGLATDNLDDIINDLLEPKLNWRELLHNAILNSIKNDYRLIPPNKRHIWRNMYLPSLKLDEQLDVAFVVDTSGSMSANDVAQGLTELVNICNQFSNYRIFYVQADYNIQSIIEITPGNLDIEKIKKITGRGGTRFPVSEIVDKIYHEYNTTPLMLIYFTDGYGGIAGHEPDCQVIWLVTSQNNFNPEFGVVIKYYSNQ
jgi:predicted metal-dependent peptidase